MKSSDRKINSVSNSESSSDTEANIKKTLVKKGTLNRRVSKSKIL